MGQNGEFGRSFMLHARLVQQAKSQEELEALPTSGLPWKCPSDMLFFRTMTNGVASETGYNAYGMLRGYFPQNQMLNMLSDFHHKAGNTHNIVLVGGKTWQCMKLKPTNSRTALPVTRDMVAAEDNSSLGSFIHSLEDRGVNVWIVGGAQVIMSALEEHAKGSLRVDNMFISTIKASGPSDILMDRSKLMMYIDSDFTYNEEYVDNKEVLIQRYRSVK